MLDQAAWRALTFVRILEGALYTQKPFTSAVLSVSRVSRDCDTISNGTNYLSRLREISTVAESVFNLWSYRRVTSQQWRTNSSTLALQHILWPFISFNLRIWWCRSRPTDKLVSDNVLFSPLSFFFSSFFFFFSFMQYLQGDVSRITER